MRKRLEKFIRDVQRMRVEDTNPEVAFLFIAFPQKLGETVPIGMVGAIAGGILRNEIDFLNALREKLFAFFDDGFRLAAPLAATERRNGAESATVVAAFCDFDVGERFWRDGQAGGRMIVEISRKSAVWKRLQLFWLVEGVYNELGGVWHVVQPDEQIDVWKTLFRLLRVALDKTACDDDHAACFPCATFPFQRGFNRLLCFLPCVQNEAAGIDEHDVRVIFFCGEQAAIFDESAAHDFCIDEIFSAAEADDVRNDGHIVKT